MNEVLCSPEQKTSVSTASGYVCVCFSLFAEVGGESRFGPEAFAEMKISEPVLRARGGRVSAGAKSVEMLWQGMEYFGEERGAQSKQEGYPD